MADDKTPEGNEVPDGAAGFPLIPPELGVHPLLLAVLHAYVFLDGSEPNIVNPAAADEAMEYLITYLQRLGGAELRRVKEDLATLAAFGKDEGWPKHAVRFLQDFLNANEIGRTP
ncbi:hypothetical protein [Urbifossiella limnaea]|uniref:Uncharacterized protein n=1 Tax=Urbifossiella limnaea TaxID=2528023 RepID=A0A517XMB9_9BACT|nr:hypothetical protein [Urbifossiella limnaea]QDU18655.1 hypothetical protein ETAA1_05480 [Urbifossiella limnaea]